MGFLPILRWTKFWLYFINNAGLGSKEIIIPIQIYKKPLQDLQAFQWIWVSSKETCIGTLDNPDWIKEAYWRKKKKKSLINNQIVLLKAQTYCQNNLLNIQDLTGYVSKKHIFYWGCWWVWHTRSESCSKRAKKLNSVGFYMFPLNTNITDFDPY